MNSMIEDAFKFNLDPRRNKNSHIITDIPAYLPDTPALPSFKEASKLYYPLAKVLDLDPDRGQILDAPAHLVILHHTASNSLDGTVEFFKRNDVDAHYVVGRNGDVVQMAENNRMCDHAGHSEWKGKTWLNRYSIGIELVNLGPLKEVRGSFFDTYGMPYNGTVNRRVGFGSEYWASATTEQEKAIVCLLAYTNKVLGIPVDNILGHYEVSPGRKNDPYGLFTVGPMPEFRSMLKHTYGLT